MDTFEKFFLLCKIIGNSIQQGNTWCPERLCIENINKISAHYHGRYNKGCIFRINLHLLCQQVNRFSNCILIAFHKFFPCNDPVFHFLLEDHICNKISHQNHIPDILILQIQTLKAHQIISDKFLNQLVIMNGCFLQFLQTLADS